MNSQRFSIWSREGFGYDGIAPGTIEIYEVGNKITVRQPCNLEHKEHTHSLLSIPATVGRLNVEIAPSNEHGTEWDLAVIESVSCI